MRSVPCQSRTCHCSPSCRALITGISRSRRPMVSAPSTTVSRSLATWEEEKPPDTRTRGGVGRAPPRWWTSGRSSGKSKREGVTVSRSSSGCSVRTAPRVVRPPRFTGSNCSTPSSPATRTPSPVWSRTFTTPNSIRGPSISTRASTPRSVTSMPVTAKVLRPSRSAELGLVAAVNSVRPPGPKTSVASPRFARVRLGIGLVPGPEVEVVAAVERVRRAAHGEPAFLPAAVGALQIDDPVRLGDVAGAVAGDVPDEQALGRDPPVVPGGAGPVLQQEVLLPAGGDADQVSGPRHVPQDDPLRRLVDLGDGGPSEAETAPRGEADGAVAAPPAEGPPAHEAPVADARRIVGRVPRLLPAEIGHVVEVLQPEEGVPQLVGDGARRLREGAALGDQAEAIGDRVPREVRVGGGRGFEEPQIADPGGAPEEEVARQGGCEKDEEIDLSIVVAGVRPPVGAVAVEPGEVQIFVHLAQDLPHEVRIAAGFRGTGRRVVDGVARGEAAAPAGLEAAVGASALKGGDAAPAVWVQTARRPASSQGDPRRPLQPGMSPIRLARINRVAVGGPPPAQGTMDGERPGHARPGRMAQVEDPPQGTCKGGP